MKLRLFFLSILLTLLVSNCNQISLENNIRVLVKGTLTNEIQTPLSNKEINVYSYAYTSPFTFSYPITTTEDAFLLGNGYSIENGTFSVLSLYHKDEDFLIHIKGDNSYSDYYYHTNTVDYEPNNFIFDLENVSLKKLAAFNYNITRTSMSGTSLTYSFSFQNTQCIEFYVNGVIDPSQSECYENTIRNDFLNDNTPEISSSFNTISGSTIEFRYSINDGPEEIETIIINNENFVYEFSY